MPFLLIWYGIGFFFVWCLKAEKRPEVLDFRSPTHLSFGPSGPSGIES